MADQKTPSTPGDGAVPSAAPGTDAAAPGAVQNIAATTAAAAQETPPNRLRDRIDIRTSFRTTGDGAAPAYEFVPVGSDRAQLSQSIRRRRPATTKFKPPGARSGVTGRAPVRVRVTNPRSRLR